MSGASGVVGDPGGKWGEAMGSIGRRTARRSGRRIGRTLSVVVGVAVVGAGLAGCDHAPSTVHRSIDPVVLTGAQLAGLVGEDPGDIVAFAHRKPDGVGTWDQVPVQVDERVVVPFGVQPPDNSTPGVTGTVYGYGSLGPTALQYADPGTWVGADTDPVFDADDELVFMVADAGSVVDDDVPAEPAGVVPGSGVAVKVEDPQEPGSVGYVYLFVRSGPGHDPAAGEDYVDYDFALTSGAYKTTYRRRTGPNPETSTVTTSRYTVGLTDRWMETSWRVGPGADLLDGHKNVFAIGECGRSNATFASAEGAFAANIDGPVRAIRAYVGANSGPRTERTHLFYREHEQTITDLRVHAIPSIVDYIDYAPGAVGSTYRSSRLPGGVAVDGVPDSVPATVPTWESVHGAEGTVVTMSRFWATYSPAPIISWFYADDSTPGVNQCWGDSWFYGASGPVVSNPIPNTDPAASPFAYLRATRTTVFMPPLTDGPAVTSIAGLLAADLDQPLDVTATAYTP